MKHIIWDFNGTLLADAQFSVDVDNSVFDQLGIPRITLDDYRENMTMPVCDFYKALGIDFSVHPYALISKLWLAKFNAGAVAVGLEKGALDTVRRLDQKGFTQSVLSASYEPSLLHQCSALGLTPFMRAISGHQDENAAAKTEIARRHLQALGLSGADTIFVGDMQADAELARTMGAECILVSWGHNDLKRLLETGLPVAHTFGELEALICSK